MLYCGASRVSGEQLMSPEEFIIHVRNGRSEYHYHKEQMAFGAAALFITGATTLIFVSNGVCNFLGGEATKGVLALLVVITNIFWLLFVYWQFENRLKAAIMVRACDIILGRSQAYPTTLTN